jgi:hypothetical protein
MKTKRILIDLSLVIIGIGITIATSLIFKGCNRQSTLTPSQKKADSIKVEIKELIRDNVIYKDRWHNGKIKFISKIDTLIKYVEDDSCKENIKQIKEEYLLQQNKTDSLIYLDSLIMTKQKTLIDINDITISSLGGKVDSLNKKITSLRNDTIPKAKRKSFIKGFKWGFGGGIIGTGVAAGLMK